MITLPKARGAVDTRSGCPDEIELCDLARGALSEERASTLRDHIGDCATCRRTVAALASGDAPRETSDAPEPDAAARYELVRLVATGGMGEVFLAVDKVLGREVALKLLHEDASPSDSRARSQGRLLREARAVARFSHPNVVAVYDFGIYDGRSFLAMEYVRGRTLRQWLVEEEPSVERIVELLAQAGEGLLAAHEAGLVHRDFKPENVLIGEDGRVKVTDFGLARVADSAEARANEGREVPAAPLVTVEGAVSGTPAYMAPEQREGKPADARSDQYAFSVTLSEALHGCRPGTVPSGEKSEKRKPLTAHIEAVIRRGLSEAPEDRWASMRQLLDALEAACRARRARHLIVPAVLVAVVAACAGVWFARRPSPSSVESALHAPCGGVVGAECPTPLVCNHPETDACGASGAAGTCQWPLDGCDGRSGPVCGCDGVSYANACDANRHGASAAYGGACARCTTAGACPDVVSSRRRLPTFCHLPSGACRPRPAACAGAGPIACGTDGQTYLSPCEARRAGHDVAHEGACAPDASRATKASPVAAAPSAIAFGAPAEQGMDAGALVDLASFVETEKLPVFSLLVSRNGVVVFELYTSPVTRDDAHYLMGVTGTVTAMLVGMAIDRHLVAGAEASVTDALPPEVFPDPEARERFRRVTVGDVLGMSALDAPIPPHDNSEPARERQRQFLASPNRAKFALGQAILPDPGRSFQFTDITSLLASGILEYAARKTELEIAQDWLFSPMDFRNVEWMHEDRAGIDNGAYGLRLRPVDMQKLGILYLQDGVWAGRQLVSREWVQRSLAPWIKTSRDQPKANYGFHWMSSDFGPSPLAGVDADRWIGRVAVGWKGQRIAIFPATGVVVTMTGVVEPPEDEQGLFRRIVRDYVIPSVDSDRLDPGAEAALAAVLQRIATEAFPVKRPLEPRMVPSVEPKERHHGFQPD
jgi:CubicO group peptidase (beta-lactamase class C family)/predicted Ser/Thr protein kinase